MHAARLVECLRADCGAAQVGIGEIWITRRSNALLRGRILFVFGKIKRVSRVRVDMCVLVLLFDPALKMASAAAHRVRHRSSSEMDGGKVVKVV